MTREVAPLSPLTIGQALRLGVSLVLLNAHIDRSIHWTEIASRWVWSNASRAIGLLVIRMCDMAGPVVKHRAKAPPTPPTYTTKSGLKVTDKRRLRAVTGTSSVAPTQPSQSRSKLRQGGLKFLGRLATSVSPNLYGDLESEELGRAVWTYPVVRRMVRGAEPDGSDFDAILQLVDDLGPDWRLPTFSWFKNRMDIGVRSALVVDAFLGVDIQTASDNRQSLLIRLVGSSAGALTAVQASTIADQLLSIASQPVDPYAQSHRQMLSRRALVTLLSERDDLDDRFLQGGLAPAGAAISGQMQRTPLPIELFATALRSRPVDYESRLIRAVESMQGSTDELEDLAQIATAERASGTARIDRNPRSVPGLPESARRILLVSLPPVVAAVAMVIVNRVGPSKVPKDIGLANSIALLALLATVHVFTVQLSAQRLPGVISATASQPKTLFPCYASVLTLVVLAVPKVEEGISSSERAWAESVVLVLFVCTLLPTMFTVLSRTDEGRAASGFVRSRRRSVQKAGKRFGRTQTRAHTDRRILDSLPAVTISVDPWIDDWSLQLRAKRRGYVRLRRRSMLRLLVQPAFRAGTRLRVTRSPGVVAGAGELIATVIPAPGQQISRKAHNAAVGGLAVASSSKDESVATSAVALVELSLSLATRGDTGTAQVVAQSLTELLGDYLEASDRSRRKGAELSLCRQLAVDGEIVKWRRADRSRVKTASSEDLTYVFVAMRDTIRSVVVGGLGTRDSMFDVSESLVRPLLRRANVVECGPSMLSAAVLSNFSPALHDRSRATDMIAIAAERALELGSKGEFAQALDRIPLPSVDSVAFPRVELEALGRIGMLSCRVGTDTSKLVVEGIERLLKQAHGPVVETVDQLAVVSALWRVGAAALIFQQPTTAIAVLRVLEKYVPPAAALYFMESEARLKTEYLRMRIEGSYLGDDPDVALRRFANFAEKTSSLGWLLVPSPAAAKP